MKEKKESLAVAFKRILDYAENKLLMNLRHYAFHVYELSDESVGVIYYPKSHKEEHTLIFYQPFSPDLKIGHVRGTDICVKMFTQTRKIYASQEAAVTVNGDSDWDFKYQKDEINKDCALIEEVDDKIRNKSKPS